MHSARGPRGGKGEGKGERGKEKGERREPCRPCICLVAAHFAYHHAALVEGRVIGRRALGALERNTMRGLRAESRESDPSGQGDWKAKERVGQEQEAGRQGGKEWGREEGTRLIILTLSSCREHHSRRSRTARPYHHWWHRTAHSKTGAYNCSQKGWPDHGCVAGSPSSCTFFWRLTLAVKIRADCSNGHTGRGPASTQNLQRDRV
jgi:hypothetical protein